MYTLNSLQFDWGGFGNDALKCRFPIKIYVYIDINKDPGELEVDPEILNGANSEILQKS